MNFEQRMTDFGFRAEDLAFEKYVKDDPRRALAIRAEKAFWRLVKSRVPEHVFTEIETAYLAWDEAAGNYEALSARVKYWQGFRDGLRVATADVGDLAISPGPSYDERRVIQAIERVERAAEERPAAAG